MKTYILQIHNTSSSILDQLFIYEGFENLCREFDKQLKYLKMLCDETIEEKYPLMDENNDEIVQGSFRFGNSDGSLTIGKVFDYHILDA